MNTPKWWNWQTRRTQNPMVAIPCGFKSHLRHQNIQPPDIRVVVILQHNPNTILNRKRPLLISKLLSNHAQMCMVFLIQKSTYCRFFCSIDALKFSLFSLALLSGLSCSIKTRTIPSTIFQLIFLYSQDVYCHFHKRPYSLQFLRFYNNQRFFVGNLE